jgi:hypothetical protein
MLDSHLPDCYPPELQRPVPRVCSAVAGATITTEVPVHRREEVLVPTHGDGRFATTALHLASLRTGLLFQGSICFLII